MAAEENQDSDQEDHLSLFLKDPAQIQHHVSRAAEDQSCDDQLRHMRSRARKQPKDNKAKGRQPFQNNCRNIFLLLFSPQEDSRKSET